LLGLAIAYMVVAHGLAELAPGDTTEETLNQDGRLSGGQP
jgi:hypothetical protein